MKNPIGMVFIAGRKYTVWSMSERLKWYVYHARRYTSVLLYLYLLLYIKCVAIFCCYKYLLCLAFFASNVFSNFVVWRFAFWQWMLSPRVTYRCVVLRTMSRAHSPWSRVETPLLTTAPWLLQQYNNNDEYEFYFASCMNIIFNELPQQRVKYDVHTSSKIKHTRRFLSHIIFIANFSAILIGTIL